MTPMPMSQITTTPDTQSNGKHQDATYTSAKKNRKSHKKEQTKRPSPLSKNLGMPKGNKYDKPGKIRRSMDTTSQTLQHKDGTKTTGLKLGPGGSEHLGCAPQDAQVNLVDIYFSYLFTGIG